MTPQELKNSILQLAIQGKLVEQRPEEGSAEELYEQIQAEKQRLIKTGVIKKEKPLPEITEDEKPFEIPESWKWIRLGEAISLLSGTDFKPEEYNDAHKGTPYITGASSLSLDGVLMNRWTETPRVIANRGDVLLVCKGSGYGKTVVCDIEEAHIARQIMAIKYSENLCMKYIKSYLEANLTIIKANGQGVIPGIDRGSVLNMAFPLPPLVEQKRIVAKIEELLPYIDRYEQAWSKLEDFNKRFPGDMQKSILQAAIQGKLVEQRQEEGTGEELYRQIQAEKQRLIKAGTIKKEKPLQEITEDEKPFDIPESWKWVRFDNLCSVLTCGYASTPTYVSKENGMPFISAKNVKPYRFLPDDHKYISHTLYEQLTQTAKPEVDDILLTRVGAGIGEAAIIDIDFDFAIYVSLTLIKLVNINLIDNKYILFWLNSPLGVMSAKKNIYGKNASQGNLNVKNVRDFLVPLPPLAEQKRIVVKLEEILPLCERLK
jgi:type I restriction enzyme, S subunit